mmetsp:Transcript_21950/g.21137  ORF Transcript_21950/g.21137 Transcript_21950/m.21137 type:complete len:907 (-) Transcript_21950:397-3117(-)
MLLGPCEGAAPHLLPVLPVEHCLPYRLPLLVHLHLRLLAVLVEDGLVYHHLLVVPFHICLQVLGLGLVQDGPVLHLHLPIREQSLHLPLVLPHLRVLGHLPRVDVELQEEGVHLHVLHHLIDLRHKATPLLVLQHLHHHLRPILLPLNHLRLADNLVELVEEDLGAMEELLIFPEAFHLFPPDGPHEVVFLHEPQVLPAPLPLEVERLPLVDRLVWSLYDADRHLVPLVLPLDLEGRPHVLELPLHLPLLVVLLDAHPLREVYEETPMEHKLLQLQLHCRAVVEADGELLEPIFVLVGELVVVSFDFEFFLGFLLDLGDDLWELILDLEGLGDVVEVGALQIGVQIEELKQFHKEDLILVEEDVDEFILIGVIDPVVEFELLVVGEGFPALHVFHHDRVDEGVAVLVVVDEVLELDELVALRELEDDVDQELLAVLPGGVVARLHQQDHRVLLVGVAQLPLRNQLLRQLVNLVPVVAHLVPQLPILLLQHVPLVVQVHNEVFLLGHELVAGETQRTLDVGVVGVLLLDHVEDELTLRNHLEDQVHLVLVLLLLVDVEIVQQPLYHVHLFFPEEVEVLEAAIILEYFFIEDVFLIGFIFQEGEVEHELQVLHIEVESIVGVELLAHGIVDVIVLILASGDGVGVEVEEVGEDLEEGIIGLFLAFQDGHVEVLDDELFGLGGLLLHELEEVDVMVLLLDGVVVGEEGAVEGVVELRLEVALVPDQSVDVGEEVLVEGVDVLADVLLDLGDGLLLEDGGPLLLAEEGVRFDLRLLFRVQEGELLRLLLVEVLLDRAGDEAVLPQLQNVRQRVVLLIHHHLVAEAQDEAVVLLHDLLVLVDQSLQRVLLRVQSLHLLQELAEVGVRVELVAVEVVEVLWTLERELLLAGRLDLLEGLLQGVVIVLQKQIL